MAKDFDSLDSAQDNNHNASPQQGVDINDDLALRKDHEFQQPHVHHSANAKRDGEDEVVYSQDTVVKEKQGGFPVDSQDNGSIDQVHLDDNLKTHSVSAFYRRYRLFVHLFIWLVFTG